MAKEPKEYTVREALEALAAGDKKEVFAAARWFPALAQTSAEDALLAVFGDAPARKLERKLRDALYAEEPEEPKAKTKKEPEKPEKKPKKPDDDDDDEGKGKGKEKGKDKDGGKGKEKAKGDDIDALIAEIDGDDDNGKKKGGADDDDDDDDD